MYSTPLPIRKVLRKADKNPDLRLDQFIVTPAEAWGNHNPANQNQTLIHWRGGAIIAQDLPNVSGSITIDTRTISPIDMRVQVELTSKEYIASSHAPEHIIVPFNVSKSVEDIENFIEQQGLQRFAYNTQNAGCFTWTKKLVEALEEHQWIPQGTILQLDALRAHVETMPQFWLPDEDGAHSF